MKFNIHQKVLILVLGTGLAALLALGIFSYFGGRVFTKNMTTMSDELVDKSASYTDELLTAQIKEAIGELAAAKAQFIDREMSITREDAEILSDAMTDIISHPERFLPKTLPDPRTDPVKNAEPYVIYAPDIRDKITPAIQREVALAANIKDMLSNMLKEYTGYHATIFVGSKNGWYICARLVDKELTDRPIEFSHERIYEFDPRKRPWYIAAKKAGTSVLSNLYPTVEAGGYNQIGASAPFYDANGNFAGVVGLDANNEDVYAWINNVWGETNPNFVINGYGEIIFSTNKNGALAVNGDDLRKNGEKSLSQAAQKMVDKDHGVLPVVVDGEKFYLAFAPMSETGWSFGLLVPEEDVLNSARSTRNYFMLEVAKLQQQLAEEYAYMRWIIVAIPVALLITLFLLGMNLSRRFVKPINELSGGVREITASFDENFDKKPFNKLEIHTGDELEHLATCFNAMTDELKVYMANLTKVTAEKERIATELDVATEIQRGMLPKDFPPRDDFEILAQMTPAKQVGGDFYDFYMLDDTHVAITVADVSGKGIPAALFMVIAKTVLNNFAASFYKQNGLAPVVEATNEKLCANNDAMMFVTAFVGVLDLQTGEFTFVNAGHNPPVLYHAAENRCEFMNVKKNFVLGPMDGIPFAEQKISLNAGDLLFVYTDGVTEALNVRDEEYLPDRLIAFMNSTDCRADLQTLLKRIRGDVAAHVGDAEQSDDITLFALRFKGSSIDAQR